MARRSALADSSARRAARRARAWAFELSSKPACRHQETKSVYEFKYSRGATPRFPPMVLVKSRHKSPPTNWNFFGELTVLAAALIRSLSVTCKIWFDKLQETPYVTIKTIFASYPIP